MTAEVEPYVSTVAVPGVRITDVVVGDRARKDYGDLTSLMDSIREHGILQPIGLLSGNRLLFGGRRLEACKRLGWESIAVVYPRTQDDALSLLKAERDENTCRKDMTISEKVTIADRIVAMERPKARDRQAQAGKEFGRGIASGPETQTYDSEPYRRSADAASEAVGMSRKTYERAKFVSDAADNVNVSDDVREVARKAREEMDAGRLGVVPAMRKVNKALGRSSESTASATAVETNADPESPDKDRPPTGRLKDRASVRDRSQRVRDLAASGHASAQIARELGLSEGGVKHICKRDGIDVPADRMLGRTRRHFDSNRFVEQTVLAAEPTPDLMAMVNFADLDRESLQRWIDSLSKSMRALQSLKRTLERELTQ